MRMAVLLNFIFTREEDQLITVKRVYIIYEQMLFNWQLQLCECEV